jgi:GH25 family lysozyme M1 (1,4-beta-N-acetylmuramidase)
MEYLVNGNVQSLKGIDLSRYQGEVDWALVAADGVDYAMIRVGIRGYGTGEIVIDDTLDANMMGATYNGIDVGAYFFTQAISEEEAIAEADAVIEALAPYNVTYPIAIDVEDVNDSSARTANLTAAQRTDYVIAFCERIESAGYTPMIYGNLKSYCDMLDMERLNEYDKWFAFYDTYVYFPYEITMWQYTDSGVVNGIEGNVDLNITFTNKYE